MSQHDDSMQSGDDHAHAKRSTGGTPTSSHGHGHGDEHSDGHGHSGHGHTHGRADPSLMSNERGLWAVKWSFVALFITASGGDRVS